MNLHAVPHLGRHFVYGRIAAGRIRPAADWPQWGGTNQRNMVSSETHLPESVSAGKLVDGQQRLDLSTALNVAWAVSLGSITFGNPVVARGRVIVGTSTPTLDPRFTGDRGAVMCFDAARGDLVWQLNAPVDAKTNTNLARGQKLGICSSATVDGDRVYVAIGQDWTDPADKGRLVCIDATGAGDITQTGMIWSYDDISHTVGTVSVTGGLVYIADEAGKVHCIDAATGKVCWVYDCKAPIWGGTLVADGKVYVGTSRGKLLILAAGRVQRLISEASLGSPIAGTPVAANGALYVATYKALYAFRNADPTP